MCATVLFYEVGIDAPDGGCAEYHYCHRVHTHLVMRYTVPEALGKDVGRGNPGNALYLFPVHQTSSSSSMTVIVTLIDTEETLCLKLTGSASG